MSSIKLRDGRVIADFEEPYIIAEVNSSHNGDINVAKQMVDVAVEAKCDCVKFQSWTTESLYSKTYYQKNPIAKRFVDKLSLNPEELKEMALYCRSKGISFSSTPYSYQEVEFLINECEAPFVKVSSMEVNNPEYLKYIGRKGIPIILSTGMADFEEVRYAMNVLSETGNKNIAILHCVSLYPTPLEIVNINNIIGLRELFPEYPIGFSDHTIGDEAAVAATVLGSAIIEKHITLDSSKIGMDNQMAMEPKQLKTLVHKCKGIVKAMGEKDRVLQPYEIKQREKMRRSIVVTRNIKVGEILSRKDLDVKRPGTGIEPKKIDQLIGCRVNKNLESDTLIMESDIEI